MSKDLINFESTFGHLMDSWDLISFTPNADSPGGSYVPGTPSAPVAIRAMPPQPMSMKDLVKDEAGEFVRDLIVTYTSETVNTRMDDIQADHLIYDGVEYEAYKMNDRRPLGNYRKVFLRKIQGDI